jgi:TonB family protein
VSDPKVISGPEELRSAAVDAVLQWHYNPQAMTLPATTEVTMNFRLLPEGAPVVLPDSYPDSYLEGKRVLLQNIVVEGLTPSARGELLQQLPIHQGDMLDADGMRATMASAVAFDEHLRVALLLNPSDENSASLRISLAAAGPPTRIRIGANVQQAKRLVTVTPVYPAEAKAQRIEGEVRLEATLGKDGKVENLQVLSGDPMLAAAALDAVRQWQYQTTLLNGDPVEVVTEIAVNFTLAK